MKDVPRLMQLCSQQQGAVSVEQLRQCGVTPAAEHRLVAQGWLAIVAPRVRAVAGSADTWRRRLQVGLLSLAGVGWVSHEAAAVLYGFDRCLVDPVHFTVPREHRGLVVPEGMTLHTSQFLGPHDLLTIGGFRCTSATRTILDLATLGIPWKRLAAAIDSAIRDGHSAYLVIAERLPSLRGSGRHGVRMVDRLLPDSGGENRLERRYLQLGRLAGLPRPDTQHRIYDGNRHVARVDFIYTELRLVVEVTGRKGHSSPTERSRDAQRRNELQDLGYRVIEYTSTQVFTEPDYVTSSMRQRLAQLVCVV